ncbi:laminin subunit alpha-like [Stylonychia lemnae]|uniref:Laminin subunit alpha-like n=1 Tax=Stylonychia lemnae TaxID=5949 RepID=A0A078AGU3_STYLE|nr:laminin subunit alpha-like [Stylonychia lemnae]|eukprot:CDW81429.1 laminin subunit alpha-like [Stylonychia lemnae]
MPAEVFVTFAKDQVEPPLEFPLVEIHTFNQYFTFQIEQPKSIYRQQSSIETSFTLPKSSGEGFIFRLKAELSSAFSDEVQQGMRVSLVNKGSEKGILADASSLDYNQGSINIEYVELQEGVEYTVRYDLYDKELISSGDVGERSQSKSTVMCQLPFVTQELLVIDKKLAKSRIQQHNRNPDREAFELSADIKCQLDHLNNTMDSEYGEDNLYCEPYTYNYKSGSIPYNSDYRIFKEHKFNVRGAQNKLITYWYEMTVGINFMVSSSVKVLLVREDKKFEIGNQLECLFDKSCVLASMSQKNMMKIDVILTTGKYKLVFLEDESTGMRRFLDTEANLELRPISLKFNSYPVLQNEERVNCPYLYMERDFIQERFITGKGGRRFQMQDKIIMNVFNLTQQFDIKPEKDSLIKIRVKEAYGVNAAVVLNQGEDCIVQSEQVGTTEMLLGEVQKGKLYYITFSFDSSVIQVSEFFQCPHFNVEISMIPTDEAKKMVKEGDQSVSDLESQEALASIFANTKTASVDSGYAFVDHQKIFQFKSLQDILNFEMSSVRFYVLEKTQMFVEVFYEPYLYDVDISIVSNDALNVRSHQNLNELKTVDWTKYKGDKKIFIELEPGSYDIKFVQKLLPHAFSSLKEYAIKTCQFQLLMILNSKVDRQQILPPSLNYLGLIGPKGSDFGEVVYHCSGCIIENEMFKTIEFLIDDDNNDVNFNAIMSSSNNKLELLFEYVEDVKTDLKIQGSYGQIFDNEVKKGNKTGIRGRIAKGIAEQNEQSLSVSKLQNKKKYRIVLQNNADNELITFDLRIELIEKPQNQQVFSSQKILPASIDEIKRFKKRGEGLKESDFLIGTKFMLNFMDENSLKPFLRKSNKVYQSKYYENGEPFLMNLKFEVNEEQAQIYAQVIDYSAVAGLGISIIRADDLNDDWEIVSTPEKYHSYISPQSLTRGSYYLVVTPMTKFEKGVDDMIRFSIDFVYGTEKSGIMVQMVLNTLELCDLPSLPRALKGPQFIHPLSGQSINHEIKVKLSDLISQDQIKFEIIEQSLVIVYAEVPKDLTTLSLMLSKDKGTFKRKVKSSDINKDADNFLKASEFKHINVVQIREFLSPGVYTIKIGADEPNTIAYPSSCVSALVKFSVTPTKNAKSSLMDQCQDLNNVGSNLKFGSVVRSNLTYNLGTRVFDTAYINLDEQGEGPFMIYIQTNYDQQVEGQLGIGLYKFDKDSRQFSEEQQYLVQDSQSNLFAVVPQGVYVMAIQSLSNHADKYRKALGVLSMKQRGGNDLKLLPSPCLNVTYTYYITSAANHDSQTLNMGFEEFIINAFMGGGELEKMMKQSEDDKILRQEMEDILKPQCQYEEMPKKIQGGETRVDNTYNLQLGTKSVQFVDILAEEDSYFKLFINVPNPKNNLNAFLYGQDSKLLGYTIPNAGQRQIWLYLQSQLKPYRLKIVQDSLDQTDNCPFYEMRVSLNPVKAMIEDDLKCTKKEAPPSEIKIGTENFDLDGEYQLSSEFFSKYSKGTSSKKMISYDINVQIPDIKRQYYFDIETRFDFEVADVKIMLFAQNQKNKNDLIFLGESEWIDQRIEDVSIITEESGYNMVSRLRLNNVKDDLSLGQELSENYVMRLIFSNQIAEMFSELTTNKVVDSSTVLCITFDLSVRITQVIHDEDNYTPDTDPTENELIRIDWQGGKLKDQKFDSRQKLSVFLQFKESMKEEFKTLKFTPFVYLVSIDYQKMDDTKIFPQTTRLSTVDKSSIILTFGHGVLQKGKCYRMLFDTQTLGVRYEDIAMKDQNVICTSSCACNNKGMQSCDEANGICLCHEPFTGPDCSQCMKGYTYDPTTMECHQSMRCIQNNGTIDCNAHGTCSEDPISGQAQCKCFLGFENDGFDFCGRCADPMFLYPNCESRNWIVEPSSYNCDNLPTRMPPQLYNDNYFTQTVPLQNSDGQGIWTGIFKLEPPSALVNKYTSTHQFIVPQNSMLRLFIDTHNSGVQAKFRVLDSNKVLLASSAPDKFQIEYEGNPETDLLYMPLDETDKSKPFYLEFEFEFVKVDQATDKCHMLEIYMLIQPIQNVQNLLVCSSEDIEASRQSKKLSYRLDYESQFITEKFILASNMLDTRNQNIKQSTDEFITIVYDLSVTRGGNALSAIASYSFEELAVELSLTDKKTSNVIAIETFGSLEDIDTQIKDMTPTNDMVSYVEIPNLEAGDYTLQIMIQKGLFLKKSVNDIACIGFDFTLEYVARSGSSASDENAELEVVSVMPLKQQIKRLLERRKFKVQVKFNRDVDINNLEASETELSKTFFLQNLRNSSDRLASQSLMQADKDGFVMYFDFSVVFKRNITEETCYSLMIDSRLFKLPNIETKYCLVPYKEREVKCNPNAMARLEGGKCQCSYPYKGAECEECDSGFIVEQDFLKHSLCVIDLKQCSPAICNNHGDCIQIGKEKKLTDYQCRCEEKYDGKYCNKCKDTNYAYPDCHTMLAEGMNSQDQSNHLQRRKYRQDGYQKDKQDYSFSEIAEGIHKEQCPVSNYPRNLNRIEFLGEFGGDMHLADFYSVNHDKDNVIQLTPKKPGVLKVLIQQPELQELTYSNENFDIEIGLYDPATDKFLASTMNHKLEFRENKNYRNGKLDYSWLHYQFESQHIGKLFYVTFRAVNFSVSIDQYLSECETVYIELQFAEQEHKCQDSQVVPQMGSSAGVIKVESNSPYKSPLDRNTFTLRDNYQTFFYYQDYYLGDYYDKVGVEQDYEIKISIQQKFTELNLVDFLVEILDQGVNYQDIDMRKHQDSYIREPTCKLQCLLSGQKAFNEFHNVVQISAKSLIRVWLHQSTNDGKCANFQLFVEANRMNLNSDEIKSLNDVKCLELNLPQTFNIRRYLGAKEDDNRQNYVQKNFHYLERFRVDNLKNNSAHTINFELFETTLVRMVSSVHQHIEYDLVLRQVKDGNSKKLIDSKAKDYEDSIFAMLERGQYQLQLLFLSNEIYLQQPCQSVEMEISMVQMRDAKSQVNQFKDPSKNFNLEEILQHPERQQQVFRDNGISFYNINDQSMATNYQSYVELYNHKFSIPKMKDLGVLITVRSDFALNNVNFALTNVNNDRLLRNVRHENMVHLVASDIPGGDYELLIYAHNCLTNVQDSYERDQLKFLDVGFQIDLNFIRITKEDDFNQHTIMVDTKESTIKTQIDTIYTHEYNCYSKYVVLDNKIIPSFVNGRVDHAYEAMIVNPQITQHQMTYIPMKDQDAIRIILDRPNTVIKLFRSDQSIERDQPITQSYPANHGEQQVILGTNLKEGQSYIFVIEFAQDSTQAGGDFEDLTTDDDDYCEHFRIQIESFKQNSLCEQETRAETNYPQLNIDENYEDHTYKMNTQQQHISLEIIVTMPSADIIISLDYSYLFYMPEARLYKQMTQELQKLIGDVRAAEIQTETQDMSVYKFYDIQQGHYSLNITLPQKPKNCMTSFGVNVISQLSGSNIANFQTSNYGIVRTYISQEEIQDLNRYVESLPISLDTYKYLKDEEYMMVSEYIRMNEANNMNKITFKIKNQNSDKTSMLRVHIENSEILMTLRSVNVNTDLEKLRSSTIIKELTNDDYELIFEFSTEQARKKSTVFKNSFHITIQITPVQFFLDKYIRYQGSGLMNCDSSLNLPLSLTRHQNKRIYENEIVYEYPLLRLSGKLLATSPSIDSYKFRVNETSRFQFSFGMHLIGYQIILKLTEMTDSGNSWIGKQEFNLNTIDTTVPPGDYSLDIEQSQVMDWNSYSNWTNQGLLNNIQVCGIFSLQGKITPISNFGNIGGLNTISKCPIKNKLPTKIYKNPIKAKGGLEASINAEGNFIQAYRDVLIKKNANSHKQPSFDRIEIEAEDDAILTVFSQHKSQGTNIVIKLFDSFNSNSDKGNQPLYHTQSVAAYKHEESQVSYKIIKDRSYYLFVYYEGQLRFDSKTNQEKCDYFNMLLSIQTITKLKQDLTCLTERDDQMQNIKQLDKDLPKTIKDNDLKNGEFKFASYTELKYPSGFEVMMAKDQKDFISLTVDIKLNQAFDIDAQMRFDFANSLFDLNVFDNIKTDDVDSKSLPEDYVPITEQAPIKFNDLDATNDYIIRKVIGKGLRANNLYNFMLADEVSYYIFKEVYDAVKQPLCLYQNIEISIKTKDKNKVVIFSENTPLIVGMRPQPVNYTKKGNATQSLPHLLPKGLNFAKVSLDFSTAPFHKSYQIPRLRNMASKKQLAELFGLQILQPRSMDVLRIKKPATIVADSKNPLAVTLLFDVTEEAMADQAGVLMRLYVDWENLVNSEKKQIQMAEGLTIPMFAFEGKEIMNDQKGKREHVDNMKIFQDRIIKIKEQQKNITCLCVHGKCLDGEKYCYKCDNGWAGKLCDLKSDSSNINQDKGEDKISYKKRITDGSRLTRDRTSSDYDQNINIISNDRDRQRKGDFLQSDINIFQNDDLMRNQFKDQTQLTQDNKNIKTDDSSLLQSFGHLLWQLILFVLSLTILALIAYGIKNRKDFAQYIPLTQSENDDDQSQPALELKEFRSEDRRKQQQQNQKDATKLKTKEFPRDIRDQLNQSKPKQQTLDQQNIQEQEEFDAQTKLLTTELELFASEQDSASMLREQDSSGLYQQQYEASEQQYQEQEHFGLLDQQQYDQNIDQQPGAYHYDEYNYGNFQYYHEPQSQQVNEIATSHEIENVLKEMKDLDEDDEEYDEDAEIRRFI